MTSSDVPLVLTAAAAFAAFCLVYQQIASDPEARTDVAQERALSGTSDAADGLEVAYEAYLPPPPIATHRTAPSAEGSRRPRQP